MKENIAMISAIYIITYSILGISTAGIQSKPMPEPQKIPNMLVVTYKEKMPEPKLPNIDTLVEYILTQSKTNMDDVNAICQVMLRRFRGSKYNTITEMLLSKSSLGSTTIKNGGGRYYFTEKSVKYRPRVKEEVLKVINKKRLVPCGKARYFSNHSCTYHTGNIKYKLVFSTSKHNFFIKR